VQSLYAEIQRHMIPEEETENEFLIDWGQASGVPLLATNGVLYFRGAGRNVATFSPACAKRHPHRSRTKTAQTASDILKAASDGGFVR